MFPDAYWAARYFPNRYWPIGAAVIPPTPTIAQSGGGNMFMVRETPIILHDNRQRAAILAALDEDEYL